MSAFLFLVGGHQSPRITNKVCNRCGRQVSKVVVREPCRELWRGMFGITIQAPDVVYWRFSCTGCQKEFSQEQFHALKTTEVEVEVASK